MTSNAPTVPAHGPGENVPAAPDEHRHEPVLVRISYVRASDHIERHCAPDTTFGAIKRWAINEFHIPPRPEDVWVLVDERTNETIGPEADGTTLRQRGYTHHAAFRLSRDHFAGARDARLR